MSSKYKTYASKDTNSEKAATAMGENTCKSPI
jgi:hypothetical protein